MSNSNDPIQALRAKRSELQSQMENCRRLLSTLEGEAARIDGALNVLDGLGFRVWDANDARSPPQAGLAAQDGVRMTVPEMIISILKRPQYVDGLEPSNVVRIIQMEFEPNADPNNIRPTIWRMGKDGRLVKEGEKYKLSEKFEEHHSSGAVPSNFSD